MEADEKISDLPKLKAYADDEIILAKTIGFSLEMGRKHYSKQEETLVISILSGFRTFQVGGCVFRIANLICWNMSFLPCFFLAVVLSLSLSNSKNAINIRGILPVIPEWELLLV